MFELKKAKAKLLVVALNEILPSPYQARERFETEDLACLAQSIQENGLLQPVSVRKTAQGKYELIAGERRFRACQMLKMDKIPAVLCDYEDAQTATLGLLENIQRKDLNPFEQARGIQKVIAIWDCTQSEAAKRLGMAQPTLANKLRLLQLPMELQLFVLENGLNERHARAVLRLPPEMRADALAHMAKAQLNARAADAYVEQLLVLSPPKHKRRMVLVHDVRLFLNTINKAITTMTESGIKATSSTVKGEDYIEYTVRIPTASGVVKR